MSDDVVFTCAGCARALWISRGWDYEGHAMCDRSAVAAVVVAKRPRLAPKRTPFGFTTFDYATVCSLACARAVIATNSGWAPLAQNRNANRTAFEECFWVSNDPETFVQYGMKWDDRVPPGNPLPEEPTTDIQRHVTKTRRVSQFVDGVGMVSHLLAEYIDRLDQLRGLRAEQRGPYAEMGINDDIGRIRAAMPRDEDEFAETLWWRAWPEEFAARQSETASSNESST